MQQHGAPRRTVNRQQTETCVFDAISWKEIFTITAAIIGAVLGIMNTWNAMAQRRIRLKVSPAHATFIGGGILTTDRGDSLGDLFCIEVTNLSTFPLTITEVGFTMGRSIRTGLRAAVPLPKILDGQAWPRRLETRESVSLYCDIDFGGQDSRRIGRAYARTACGSVRYGSSPALRQLRS
jgi:hypothetical protein